MLVAAEQINSINCLMFQISFLEVCLNQFQVSRAAVTETSIATKETRHPAHVLTTLKRLYRFNLVEHFVIHPPNEINEDNDSTFSAICNGPQNVYYDSFCFCFHQLLDQKYGHLDELALFGEKDKPGVIVKDFASDLKTCTQLENYKAFFAKLFVWNWSVSELQETFVQWYDVFLASNHSSQVQQEILSQVRFFCFYLIDSRSQTIKVLEQYEQGFYSEICSSYSRFLSIMNSNLCDNLSSIVETMKRRVNSLPFGLRNAANSKHADVQCHEILHLIKNLVEIHNSCSMDNTEGAHKMRANILAVEIELYKNITKVLDINKEATELVNQLLCSSTNHFAYLHKHLTSMGELLRIFLDPYAVSCQAIGTYRIYTVAMSIGSISGALSAFSEWLSYRREQSLKEGDLLRLCSDSVLYLDSDVIHDSLSFQGVSIALISPNLTKTQNGEIIIFTDGESLNNLDHVEDASSGEDGTEEERDGQPGRDGENGQYGNPGGHILIVSNSLDHRKFNISACGSRGQDGQNGGNGGDGWTPPNELEGRNGLEPTFKTGSFRTEDSVVMTFGTFGTNGGQGGDAGMGGAAGKSGISGKMEIIDLDNEANCIVSQVSIEDGEPGKPGKPGKGGRHTRHGRDWGKYASNLDILDSLKTLFTQTRPNKSIKNIKGELEHPLITPERRNPGKPHEEKSKDPPTQRKRESHPDFTDRGCNRKGRIAHVKKNTAIAKENKVIDKKACLETMVTQCRKKRNHWNAKPHHSFLKMFAYRIGESYQVKRMAFTHTDKINAERAGWIDSIQKLSGKTEVTYRRLQQTSVQLMRDRDEKLVLHSSSYLSVKREIDGNTSCIKLCLLPFKARALERGVVCDDLPLELILTSDEHDNDLDHLTSQLGLSENYVYIVIVDDIRKAKELASNYDFLFVKNGPEKEREWCLYHTLGRAVLDTDDEQFTDSLNEIELTEINQPVSMEEFGYCIYQNMLEWINAKLGANSSLVLPCTIEQIHCIELFKLVVAIKRSYKTLYAKCDEEWLHLFQLAYAKFLSKVVKSSKEHTTIPGVKAILKGASEYLILPINVTWLAENTARSSKRPASELKAEVKEYNKAYTLSGLLKVLNSFLKYDVSCYALAKEKYISLLTGNSKTHFETFKAQLEAALELLSPKKLEKPPDIKFTCFDIQEILLHVSIPHQRQSDSDDLENVELYLYTFKTYTLSTDISPFVDTLTSKMQQLWNFSIPPNISKHTIRHSKQTFRHECNTFRTNPSLRDLPQVMQTYSKLKPILAHCKVDLEYLLDYTFDQMCLCLVDSMQKSLQPTSSFSTGISIVEFESIQQSIKTIPQSFSKARAVDFLLEQMHIFLFESQNVKIDSGVQLMEPSSILSTGSSILAKMLIFYEGLFYSHRDSALTLIPQHIEIIRKLNTTLLWYQLSCPYLTLMSWASSFEKLLPSVLKKTEIFKKLEVPKKTDIRMKTEHLLKRKEDKELDDKVCEHLNALHHELSQCQRSISSLAQLRRHLDLVTFAENLSRYTLLYNASKQPKSIMQTCLGLHESFIEAGYLECFADWLQPGLLGLSVSKLTIEMKRCNPRQNLLVLSQEPKEIPMETIILLAADNSTWKTCSIDTSTTEIYQYRDVSSEVINNILGMDAHRRVTEIGEIKLTKEQQAEVLGKLSFEEEFSVACNVQFCGQTVICNGNGEFLELQIDLATNSIDIKRQKPTKYDKQYPDQKIILTFGHKSHLDALQLPYIDAQELAQIEGFLCILKQPSQRAIIKSVTNCGECATIKFCYSPPLATEVDATNSTFIELVRPVSDLLNSYQDLYQIYLPQDQLKEKFSNSLNNCKKTLFQSDILHLVRTIRSNFIWSVLDDIDPHSLGNLKTVLDLKEDLTSAKSNDTFIIELFFTGLELFTYFVLVEKAQQRSSVTESMQQKTTENFRFYLYWKYIQRERTLSDNTAKNLLTAFAYIKNFQSVDIALQQESTEVQFQAYTMTVEGLLLLDLHIGKDGSEKQIKQIKHLLHKASYQVKNNKIEMIWNCSKVLPKDNKNVPSLVDMVYSIEPLGVEVAEMVLPEDIVDTEKCQHLLTSSSFFISLTDKVLEWCNKKFCDYCQTFQFAILDSQDQQLEAETAICAFTSLIMNGAKRFAERDWKSVHQLIEIAEKLTTEDRTQIAVRRMRDPFSLVIQTIEVSDDLEDVKFILDYCDIEKWLPNLITSNFLSVFQNHYSITVDESKCHQLLELDVNLLQIFYNVFVSDQYNQLTSDSQCGDLAGYVKLEQFFAILNWLSLIEPCPNAYTVLCRTSLALWEKELPEIYFKQYLDHWTDISEADKQKTVYLMNRVRLTTGVNPNEFISLLCTVRRKYVNDSSKNTQTLLEMFEDLYYERVTLKQVEKIVSKQNYRSWSIELGLTKYKSDKNCKLQSLSKVLSSIKAQIHSGDYDTSMDQFEKIETEAEKIVCLVEKLNEMDETSFAQSKKKVFTSLKRNRSIEEKIKWLEKRDHRVKFVAHIVITWTHVTSKAGSREDPYNTQIVSLLLFLHANDKGVLQQVKTGEGKTCIVAMLAAAKALLGYHVDVVSSNRDLAQDGMRKCQPFFSSLGLQAAVNCTEDDDTNQQAYKSHIVYGDVGSFQRDVLTEECKPGGTSFSARYSDLSRNCLIADEVDSMFLDKARHMLYLSHETAALKHLETLFIMIWSAVLSVSQETELPVEEVTSQLAQKLCILIDNGTIIIPKYLFDFCKRKLKNWVRSAYEARFMDVDDQFIIDRRTKDSKTKQIFPIDKQTGIEQYNMKWTDGLSQFLELKYQRPLSTESLRAVFISNKRFYKRYEKQLFGLTGTLGSASSRSLLKNVYSIKTVELPTYRLRRYIQTKSQVATSDEEWCTLINNELSSKIKEQPVLVICENIKRLTSLKGHIDREIEVIEYARACDSVEDKFTRGACPGQLILATNKGGRGTNIMVDDTKAPKGLHVILSFLPENTRIEQQAFGRAARAGQPGSGCLIIQINESKYAKIIQKFENLDAAAEILVEMEKIERDRAETEYLSLLLNEEIPKLDLEEELYKSFQQHRKTLTDILNTAKLFEVCIEDTKHIKPAFQDIITNQWAFWLVSMHDQIHLADSPDKRKAIVDLFKAEFPCEGISAPSTDPDSSFFRMPEYYINLGQAYLKEAHYLNKQRNRDGEKIKDLYTAACTCFQRAHDMGDLTGFAAMAQCVCLFKLDSSASREKKKDIRRCLKVAKSSLSTLSQEWLANCEVSKALSGLVDVSQYVHESENHYAQQIEGKLKVIELHLNILESLLGSSLNEFSFVHELSQLEEEKLSEEQSKDIYHTLWQKGIICHHKVCKYWKNKERLEALFKKDVDATIADGLIQLILEKPTISEDDLTPLVNSSEELWDKIEPLIQPATVVDVRIIKVEQIINNKKLLADDEQLITSWAAFLKEIGSHLRKDSQCVLTSGHPVYSKMHTDYSQLTAHLRSNGLCFDTRQGTLRNEASDIVETISLGKFQECKLYDDCGEEQSLQEFLTTLVDYCSEHEEGYIYEYMLPFEKRSQMVKKVHFFLRRHEILKSGKLDMGEYKYDDGDHEIRQKVEETLGIRYTKQQIKFVLSVLNRLKGEVHKIKENMQVEFVTFYDLKDRPEDVPEELDFFTAWHMDHFLSFEQQGMLHINVFTCAMLGFAQISAGVTVFFLTAGASFLFSTTLIVEGFKDLSYAFHAARTGTFSWEDYTYQKTLRVTVTIATGGLNHLVNAPVGARIGAATRLSSFVATVERAAGNFASRVAPRILSALTDVREHVVDTSVNFIEKSLLSSLRREIRARLEQMARESANDDEFRQRSKTLIRNLRSEFALDTPGQPTYAFERMESQAVSSLTRICRDIADQLKDSNSRLTRAESSVAFFVEQMCLAVQGSIRIANAAHELLNISDYYQATLATAPVRSEHEIDIAVIDKELDDIEAVYKEFITKQIQERIRSALDNAIRKSLKQIALATNHLIERSVRKVFSGKTTADLVKDFKAKKEAAVLIKDHDHELQQSTPAELNDKETTTVNNESPIQSKHRAFVEKRDSFQKTIVAPTRQQHCTLDSADDHSREGNEHCTGIQPSGTSSAKPVTTRLHIRSLKCNARIEKPRMHQYEDFPHEEPGDSSDASQLV